MCVCTIARLCSRWRSLRQLRSVFRRSDELARSVHFLRLPHRCADVCCLCAADGWELCAERPHGHRSLRGSPTSFRGGNSTEEEDSVSERTGGSGIYTSARANAVRERERERERKEDAKIVIMNYAHVSFMEKLIVSFSIQCFCSFALTQQVQVPQCIAFTFTLPWDERAFHIAHVRWHALLELDNILKIMMNEENRVLSV